MNKAIKNTIILNFVGLINLKETSDKLEEAKLMYSSVFSWYQDNPIQSTFNNIPGAIWVCTFIQEGRGRDIGLFIILVSKVL